MIAIDKGTGTPIVLIHGFGVDHHILEPLGERMLEQGFRTIYLALPWVQEGLNPAVTSTQELANLVVEALRAYLPNERFAILGNSYGGQLARYAAHALPDNVCGVATLASVFESTEQPRITEEQHVVVRDPQISQALESADESAQVNGFGRKIIESYAEMAVTQSLSGLTLFGTYIWPGIVAANARVLAKISKNYELPKYPEQTFPGPYEKPALHMFGRHDHVTGFKNGLQWEAHYPQGKFEVIEGAGHNIHLDQPEVVHELLKSWLSALK